MRAGQLFLFSSNIIITVDTTYFMCRYEYRLTREYNWNVKNKASKGYEVCFPSKLYEVGMTLPRIVVVPWCCSPVV